MQILLINLARRPDRLAFMRSQLDALGLAFERIEAVDGRQEDVGPGTDLVTPVEIACALSHRKAWLRLLDSGDSHCLVLEDDVLIAPGAKLLLDNPRGLPRDADIVRLETTLERTLLGFGQRCGLPAHKVHRLYSRQRGTAAYIITRAFAERAVRDLTTFGEPIDDILFVVDSPGHFPSIRYQIRPGLCLQADLYAPARKSLLAASDLDTDRKIRWVPPKPVSRIKTKYSFSKKCLRELNRWWRRSRATANTLHQYVIVGRIWRDVPFIGTVLPAAAAALAEAETLPSCTPASHAMPTDIATKRSTGPDPVRWGPEPHSQGRARSSIRS
ncbi:glycosyltransferase family 25 protein [Xanthobacter autotrophicus]|uniref:glycosyltransferase family 25 protein n=1 Tax=Xanthobacter autotrophicus TaxID=280 RepID=UPI003727BC8E